MLSDPENSRAVTWMPHGRAWKILDKEVLVSEILPRYKITCTKYESFSRQLNAWGFKRLYQSGPDLGCYYHECFLRDLPELTWLILRLATNQGKATPYPAGEPNFYQITERFPLPPPPLAGTGGTSNGTNASPEVHSGQDPAAGGTDVASRLSLMAQQWQQQQMQMMPASAANYSAQAPAGQAQFVPSNGQSPYWGGSYNAYPNQESFSMNNAQMQPFPQMPSQALRNQVSQLQFNHSLIQQQLQHLQQQYGNIALPQSNAEGANPAAASFDFRFNQAGGQGGGDSDLEPAPYHMG
ncbi:hypothetical protein ACHAWF_013309 [Thalassiosira exigua]